ncbi:MAG: hypothetical protein HYV35_01650 [Lentisphaerae bacterium]|nr:hypothetical protein [Lentisphaerota bacterium]
MVKYGECGIVPAMHFARLGRFGICLAVIFPAVLAAAADIDFAPLFSSDTDVVGQRRWRALGPLLEWKQSDTGRTFLAVHPLYSSVATPLSPVSAERQEVNLLWPLWVRKQGDNESKWQFLALVYASYFDVANPAGRYQFAVFPIYIQGRDEEGTPYLALVPLGGVARDFLGRDRISFVLFPLTYADQVDEVKTRAWLWPIVSSTWGGGHERFRVFPFYGVSRRRQDYEKRFIFWPVWSSARYWYPESSGSGYVLFPLLGHLKLTDQESWMVLPPLMRFSKGAKKSEVNCPWPFFQWSSGEVRRLYFWPLWGRKTMAGNDSAFVLWPLYHQARRYSAVAESTRRMLIPFLYYTSERKRVREEPGQGDVVARTLKVWPLFSSRSSPEGFQLRALSLFPYKDYGPIERNYAPLWTLYSHTAGGPVKEDELLWGLFRWRRATTGAAHLSLFPVFAVDRSAGGDARGWSVLKGLLGYERTGAKKTIRVLYFLKF